MSSGRGGTSTNYISSSGGVSSNSNTYINRSSNSSPSVSKHTSKNPLDNDEVITDDNGNVADDDKEEIMDPNIEFKYIYDKVFSKHGEELYKFATSDAFRLTRAALSWVPVLFNNRFASDSQKFIAAYNQIKALKDKLSDIYTNKIENQVNSLDTNSNAYKDLLKNKFEIRKQYAVYKNALDSVKSAKSVSDTQNEIKELEESKDEDEDKEERLKLKKAKLKKKQDTMQNEQVEDNDKKALSDKIDKNVTRLMTESQENFNNYKSENTESAMDALEKIIVKIKDVYDKYKNDDYSKKREFEDYYQQKGEEYEKLLAAYNDNIESSTTEESKTTEESSKPGKPKKPKYDSCEGEIKVGDLGKKACDSIELTEFKQYGPLYKKFSDDDRNGSAFTNISLSVLMMTKEIQLDKYVFLVFGDVAFEALKKTLKISIDLPEDGKILFCKGIPKKISNSQGVAHIGLVRGDDYKNAEYALKAAARFNNSNSRQHNVIIVAPNETLRDIETYYADTKYFQNIYLAEVSAS